MEKPANLKVSMCAMLTLNASHLEPYSDTVDLEECQIRCSGVCWGLLGGLSI
jgi:hypothetical protein